MEAESIGIDRIPADFMQNPYELLRNLRSQAPIHEVVFAHGAKVFLVTGYDEVRALSKDPRVSKDGHRMNEMFARHSGMPFEPDDDQAAGVGFDDDLAAHMLNSDPPRHTRLRALVGKAFTAQRVEKLRPRVEQVVDELLAAFEGRDDVDLVAEFAVRLPITIICDLFGVPPEDREDVRRWSIKLVGAGQDPDEVSEASKRMVDYANALVDSRRANPGDDMLSELVRVSDGTDRLTRGELVSMIFVLVVAGHITTIHSIGNAAASLLSHPLEMARLRAEPTLISAAVDELLRFDGPSGVGTFRFTKDEIPVGDVTIPAGQLLALSWHSANRDSTHFPEADRLDLHRRPVGSMAFGHGIHYCIGVPLAKMQIEIAIWRLLSRYPDLRLTVAAEQLRREDSALLRGLVALPVSVRPRTAGPNVTEQPAGSDRGSSAAPPGGHR